MKKIHVKVTTLAPMLGSQPNNPELHEAYIASKAPDAMSLEEEVAAVGAAEVVEQSMTVFHRHDGRPVLMDYQIKGFFKDTCAAMRKLPSTKSSKIKAYKKEIDGLIFVVPRFIPITFTGEMTTCQRPLRASTPMGERVALANSEQIPEGAQLEFDVICLADGYVDVVKEWLLYGHMRGLGQWRNSGMGRFKHEIVSVEEMEDLFHV